MKEVSQEVKNRIAARENEVIPKAIIGLKENQAGQVPIAGLHEPKQAIAGLPKDAGK